MLRRAIPLAMGLALITATPAGGKNDDVPYWATIDVTEANMRVGPSREYRIDWVYKRKGLPVKVLRVREGWRLVEDPAGDKGWIAARLLSRTRGAIVTGEGLAEVTAPSALFLSERGTPAAGSVVFAGIEGTRPVLCELQALVAPSPHSQARRTVVGWDGGRLAMILAVLEARCGIPFAGLDVYLNVAGGMKISEPAADLAVAAALLSAREDVALPAETVVFGEISLSGALRPASQTENRLKEAQKLGFTSAIAPAGGKPVGKNGITLNTMSDLTGFVGEIFGAG